MQGLGARLLQQHIRYEAAMHLVCKGAGTLKARSTLHVSLAPTLGVPVRLLVPRTSTCCQRDLAAGRRLSWCAALCSRWLQAAVH